MLRITIIMTSNIVLKIEKTIQALLIYPNTKDDEKSNGMQLTSY